MLDVIVELDFDLSFDLLRNGDFKKDEDDEPELLALLIGAAGFGSSGFFSKGFTEGHESRFAGIVTLAFGLKSYFFFQLSSDGVAMMLQCFKINL